MSSMCRTLILTLLSCFTLAPFVQVLGGNASLTLRGLQVVVFGCTVTGGLVISQTPSSRIPPTARNQPFLGPRGASPDLRHLPPLLSPLGLSLPRSQLSWGRGADTPIPRNPPPGGATHSSVPGRRSLCWDPGGHSLAAGAAGAARIGQHRLQYPKPQYPGESHSRTMGPVTACRELGSAAHSEVRHGPVQGGRR